MVHESLPEVRGMTDVTLVRMTQAFDHVCVEHGLPSIAWKPSDEKSSFAKPMEDILRLDGLPSVALSYVKSSPPPPEAMEGILHSDPTGRWLRAKDGGSPRCCPGGRAQAPL